MAEDRPLIVTLAEARAVRHRRRGIALPDGEPGTWQEMANPWPLDRPS